MLPCKVSSSPFDEFGPMGAFGGANAFPRHQRMESSRRSRTLAEVSACYIASRPTLGYGRSRCIV